jgi:TatD DNase family protein
MSHFFDAHTHVQLAAFKEDWKQVIERALAQDVWMINVGTERSTSAKAVEMANLYKEGVYAAVALHPTHTNDDPFHDVNELENAKSGGEEFDYNYYLELGKDPKVVAIGECGLDYFRMEGSPDEIEEKKRKQKVAFEAQMQLAKELEKPLMVHCRDAFPDLITMLKDKYQGPPGLVHFFTGTPEDAMELVKLGFSFTFGGVITFARNYDETIKLIPLERILSETDAPYVAPLPHRGKRNEPAYVISTVQKLAEIKGISTEAMKEAIFLNAQKTFGIG